MTSAIGSNSMSISQRLMTLGITAFVSVGAIVGVGWYQQTRIETSLAGAARLVVLLENANTMKAAHLETILTAMDTIVDRGEGKVQPERLLSVETNLAEIKKDFPAASELAATVGRPDLVQTLEADIATIARLIMVDLKTLVETNGSDESFDAIDDTIDSLGETVTQRLTELASLGSAADDATIGAANAQLKQSTLIQLGFGLLAMAIMALLQWRQSSAIRKSIRSVKISLERIAQGSCDEPVQGLDGRDEIGDMARAAEICRQANLDKIRIEQQASDERDRVEQESLARQSEQFADAEAIRNAVQTLAGALTRLSEGDLSATIDKPFRADLEPVRADFNRLTEKLRAIMAEIGGNSSSIQANAQQMRSAADDLAKRTEQQAASLEQTSAALEQITRTVRVATDRAEGASQLVSNAKDFAESSSQVVTDAMAAMERIESATGEIGKIINVVDEIAFQTNLLALNAGVEAARAGEAGKGFAVVAQEVRELAGRAAGAAKDIKALVTRSSGEVQNGVKLVRATGEALHRIGDDVLKINGDVSAIVTSAREQFTGLSEINSAIGQMDQTTQQNAAMVEETNASSHTLASDADNLTRLMGQFRLGGAAPSGPRSINDNASAAQPRPSPARSLMNRVAGAISSSNTAARPLATATSEKWEEF